MAHFSDTSLRRMYNCFNKRYWSGELPEDVDVLWHPVKDDHMAETEYCDDGGFVIRLSPSIAGFDYIVRQKLLHEMTHVRTWIKHPAERSLHGYRFKKEWLRVLAAGAWIYC